MLEGIVLWHSLREALAWRGPDLTDLERHRMIRELVGLMVSDLVDATESRLGAESVSSPLEIQKLDHNLVGYGDTMQRQHRELKDFLYQNLYSHFRVLRMAVKAERVISDLFAAYRAEPAILPAGPRQAIDGWGLDRAICDYIAGMTDRFAIEEYRKLFDPLELP
jgi:dGTPase